MGPKQSRMIVLIVLGKVLTTQHSTFIMGALFHQEQGMKDSPNVPAGTPDSSTNEVSKAISLNIFGSEARSEMEGSRVVFV